MNEQSWEHACSRGPSEDSPGKQTLTLHTAEREENSGLEVALGYTVVLIFKHMPGLYQLSMRRKARSSFALRTRQPNCLPTLSKVLWKTKRPVENQ